MPALIITRPDGSVYTEDLSEHEKKIGSSRHNQCVLPEVGVSHGDGSEAALIRGKAKQ